MAEKGKANIKNNSSCDEVPGQIVEILCQPCSSKDKQTVAEVYCLSCDEYQCGECSSVHDTFGSMKTHKKVSAKKAKSKPVSFDMKGLDLCDQHHDEILIFFCEDENQLCCGNCAIVEHRKCHSVVEIQKLAQKATSAGSKIQGEFLGIKSKAEILVNHTQSLRMQLNRDVKEIHLKIKRMRDNVNQMFNDMETSVSNEMKLFEKETIDKLQRKEKISEKHVTDATKSLATIENVYRDGTRSQQFIVSHKMKKLADKLQKSVEEERLKTETVNVAFEFDEILKLPDSPHPNQGYVPGKLTLKCASSEALKLTKVVSIKLKKSKNDTEEPLYSGLDFLSDGRLVAVDNHNKKCFILSEKLEKVGSYQLSYSPHRVVVVSEEEVAITIGRLHKIDFLRVSKSNEITLTRTCKVKTPYVSICMKDDGNFVVGTINDTKHVRIVSLSGQEKDFSINFPNKQYPIGTSACTYIRNSDKVVLTDRYEHTVYIYDVATNTRVVVKDDQIKEPRCAAVGPSDCILVCSHGTDSIVQISPTGCILSSYKLDIKYPRSVCISQDKSMLAVSNKCNHNKKLQLFKITQ